MDEKLLVSRAGGIDGRLGEFGFLAERVRYLAENHPEKPAFTFLTDNGRPESSLTYKQLYDRASIIGSELAGRGLQGKNVILMYPPGLDFIAAFLGCLVYGIIPCPLHEFKLNRSNDSLINIINSTDASALLCNKKIYADISRLLEGVEVISTDELSASESYIHQQFKHTHSIKNTELAFIQFTSGSTSTPKGVMVSHKNLFTNVNMMQAVMGTNSESVFVCWLPHYHDMGLVGNILHSMFVGAFCVVMNPMVFLARPVQWLRAVEQFQGSIITAPNFAYQHCINKIPDTLLADLDLSSITVAVNAAEPVYYKTIEQFTKKFAQTGLKPEALCPYYGMAEATVFVSGDMYHDKPTFLRINRDAYKHDSTIVLENEHSESLCLVACGENVSGQDIIIVEPESQVELAEAKVGEIWISGENISSGYYKNNDANKKSFACLTDKEGHVYYRTGDLGFFYDNKLYISGRSKDMIIINGANYYPQDIEIVVEEVSSSINANGVAAFSFHVDGKEQLIVAIELTRNAVKELSADVKSIDKLGKSIKYAISENIGVSLAKVVFTRPRSLPKTSSGKVCRSKIAKAFEDATLEYIGCHPSGDLNTFLDELINLKDEDKKMTNIEQTLKYFSDKGPNHLHIFSQLVDVFRTDFGIGISDIDVSKSVFSYGIDSIRLIDIHSKLEKSLKYQIPTEIMFKSNDLVSLIDELVNCANGETEELNFSFLDEDVNYWTNKLIERKDSSPLQDSTLANEIFLTGTSGYLGIYLLKDLLLETDADIYCLVRAMDETMGLNRIINNAKSYEIGFSDAELERIKVIIGDVSKEKFGLDDNDYLEISRRVGSVYHCAAIDNFYLPYNVVRSVNVIGVVHIIEFCLFKSKKSLFHVSSCAASLIDGQKNVETIGLVNGYAQSKYVSEKIVLELNKQGMDITNYRFGYLYSLEADMADEEQGFETFITAMLKMECMPNIDMVFDLTPVEYSSKSIVRTSKLPRHSRKSSYTFYNPAPLRWQHLAAALTKLCPQISTVSLDEFVEKFQEYVMNSNKKNVKLLKSVVSADFEKQINLMFNNIEWDDVGLLKPWCPHCDKGFVEHYVELALGDAFNELRQLNAAVEQQAL